MPAAAAAGVVGVALWLVAPLTTRQQAPRYGTSPVPLTAYPGWEGVPSLSPDGTQVAFNWTGNRGDPDIYVKLVGEGQPVRLTTDTRWEMASAWSPDGRPWHSCGNQAALARPACIRITAT